MSISASSSDQWVEALPHRGDDKGRRQLEGVLISRASLLEVCPTPLVMVYGWHETRYSQVMEAYEELRKEQDSRIKAVYASGTGYTPTDARDWGIPEEDRRINRLDYVARNEDQHLARRCKMGLRNVVLANYERERMGLPTISVIICHEDDATASPYSSEMMDHKKRITAQEYRAIYDLCHDPELPERVREVAKRTFHFIKLEAGDWVESSWGPMFRQYKAVKVPSPLLDNPELDRRMQARKELKKQSPSANAHWNPQIEIPYQEKAKELNWVQQMIRIVKEIDSTPLKPESASVPGGAAPKKGWTCWDVFSAIIFPIMLWRMCVSGTWWK